MSGSEVSGGGPSTPGSTPERASAARRTSLETNYGPNIEYVQHVWVFSESRDACVSSFHVVSLLTGSVCRGSLSTASDVFSY